MRALNWYMAQQGLTILSCLPTTRTLYTPIQQRGTPSLPLLYMIVMVISDTALAGGDGARRLDSNCLGHSNTDQCSHSTGPATSVAGAVRVSPQAKAVCGAAWHFGTPSKACLWRGQEPGTERACTEASQQPLAGTESAVRNLSASMVAWAGLIHIYIMVAADCTLKLMQRALTSSRQSVLVHKLTRPLLIMKQARSCT